MGFWGLYGAYMRFIGLIRLIGGDFFVHGCHVLLELHFLFCKGGTHLVLPMLPLCLSSLLRLEQFANARVASFRCCQRFLTLSLEVRGTPRFHSRCRQGTRALSGLKWGYRAYIGLIGVLGHIGFIGLI